MENIKRVYICHPYTGDPEGNVKKVNSITQQIGQQNALNYKCYAERLASGVATVCATPTILIPLSAFKCFPESMCEPHVSRKDAMTYCIALLAGCDEIWVYSRSITHGMKDEIEYASNNGIKIVWKV